MKNLGVGVIGTGDRAIGYLKDTFRKMAEEGSIRLVGVADINPVRGEEAQKDLGAKKRFTDYRDLISEDGLEAVFVMTPESVHAEISIAALNAGKHVYCEKPMATTLEDCNNLVEVAKNSNAIFFAGHNVRYNPVGRTINRIIKEGGIGEVHMVWARRFVEGAKYWHRWHRRRENSGGLLVHKGSHYLDQMNWDAGGRPRYVSAFGSLDVYQPREDAPERCLDCEDRCDHYLDLKSNERHVRYFLNAEKEDGYLRDQCVFAPGSDVFDNAVVAVEYSNGVKGTYMECHFVPIMDRDTERGAVGDEGLILGSKSPDGKHQIRLENRKTHTVDIVEPDSSPPAGNEGAIRTFFDCIDTGEQPESDCEAGWDSSVVGIAAQKSADERKTAKISVEKRSIEMV